MSSDSVGVFPFSKKTLLVRLQDPEKFSKWNKILTQIGAMKNNSNDDPGWLLPKDRLEQFEDALAQYGSRQKPKRSRIRRSAHTEAAEATDSPPRRGSRFRKREPDERPRDAQSSGSQKERKHRHSVDSADSRGSRGSRYSRDDEREDEESEESSDDELIQTVLKRRILSESSHKNISEEEIPNSDDEDCVSYSRRLRHIYTIMKEFRSKISTLENVINSLSLNK